MQTGIFGGFKEAVGLAIDALRTSPMRSFLTVLGIVIGVGTVIAIGAVVNGLNSSVTDTVESLGSNMIIASRFNFATLGRLSPEVLQRKELKAEWAEGLAQLPHVAAATPNAHSESAIGNWRQRRTPRQLPRTKRDPAGQHADRRRSFQRLAHERPLLQRNRRGSPLARRRHRPRHRRHALSLAR